MRHIFAGCQIKRELGGIGHGSLTCFLSRNDGHLYALTAKHCMPDLAMDVYAGATKLGTVVQVTGGIEDPWDAALIRVFDTVARDITAENLQAVVSGRRTTLNALAEPDYDAGGDQTLEVMHAGSTSARHATLNYGIRRGSIDIATGTGEDAIARARITMENRRTIEGDSGGPVFTPGGTLVGFVSVGDLGGVVGRTRVMLARPICAHFGATLATMVNEAQWRPAALPAADPDADPFNQPGVLIGMAGP